MTLLEMLESVGERLNGEGALPANATEADSIRSAITNVSEPVLFAWFEGLSERAQQRFAFQLVPVVLGFDLAARIIEATYLRHKRLGTLEEIDRKNKMIQDLGKEVSILMKQLEESEGARKELAGELAEQQAKAKRSQSRNRQAVEEGEQAKAELAAHVKNWKKLAEVMAFVKLFEPLGEETDEGN